VVDRRVVESAPDAVRRATIRWVRTCRTSRPTPVASLVAHNRGYSWGISRALRAAVLPKLLVESRCDDEVPPRNEKVVGSIPTGGSTQTPRSYHVSRAQGEHLLPLIGACNV
jgi:hypothetical protein